MKILVIGVGGIGGFIGSYLVNNNYDVTFIARKKRLNFSENLKLIQAPLNTHRPSYSSQEKNPCINNIRPLEIVSAVNELLSNT